jgi:hypothetical protein
MIQYGILFLGVVLLVGCDAERFDSALSLPAQKSVNEVSITDLRPSNQKLANTMSFSMADCQYGSYQLADHYETPGRVSVLTRYLSNELPENYQDKVVNLRNFTIHVNAFAQLTALPSVAYPNDDQTETSLLDVVIGCSNDDLMGGYSLAEVDDLFPPLVAVADLEVDGKVYHARVIRSLDARLWGRKNSKWDALMSDVVLAIGAELIAEITAEHLASTHTNAGLPG